ncbi:MAG: polysaccharide biosynthesis protein [Bacteroidota bacterium]
MRKLTAHPHYEKICEWFRLITITGGAQLVVQATALISGIIIIRLLPTKEYALYTLANTMLGTLSVLSDGGISSGVMAQGGKVWRDKVKLGEVLATGLNLRRKFALVTLIIIIPILSYLLYHHGAGFWSVILIVGALVPAFFAILSDSLLEIVPKLHQDIGPLQKNQVSVSLTRTLLSAFLLFFFPFSFLAIFINGLTRIYGNFQLKKIAAKFTIPNQAANPVIEKEILRIVKRVLPTSIYYCFSGQITVWLISIFGNTNSLAEIGAISRLTMVIGVLSAMFGALVVPRFSRLEEVRQRLLNFFLNVQVLVIFSCLIIILLTWIFSSQLLYVLGKNYASLDIELLLSMIGACISFLAGVSFTLYNSRGWMINPFLSIGIDIFVIIIGVFLFPVSTLKGVLAFNILTASFLYFSNTWYAFYKIRRSRL